MAPVAAAADPAPGAPGDAKCSESPAVSSRRPPIARGRSSVGLEAREATSTLRMAPTATSQAPS